MTDRPATAQALDASRKPVEVLKFLGLKRGDRVLDVMTGGGYYAEIIGNAIGSYGTVLAMESTVFASDKLRASFAALVDRVPNVTFLAVMPAEFDPPANAYDFVLMHLVYHDLYWSSDQFKFPRTDPAVFLTRLYAATKPGGIVGVVDHVAPPRRRHPRRRRQVAPHRSRRDQGRLQGGGLRAGGGERLLRNSADPMTESGYDGPGIKGKTDRVVLRFRKPA